MTSSSTETEARMAEMRAEIERLREALEPFANLADEMEKESGLVNAGGGGLYFTPPHLNTCRVYMRDLRAARNALGEGGRD